MLGEKGTLFTHRCYAQLVEKFYSLDTSMGKHNQTLVALITRPTNVEPSSGRRSSVHHSFDVPPCSPLRRLPPRPRSPRYVYEFFSTRTSRSHVSTSTWGDARGVRWMTDDEASVFPPTSSRAIDGWGVEPASRRRARDVGDRTRRGVKEYFLFVCVRVACARNATVARREASERAGRSRDDVDGSREWLTCRGNDSRRREVSIGTR